MDYLICLPHTLSYIARNFACQIILFGLFSAANSDGSIHGMFANVKTVDFLSLSYLAVVNDIIFKASHRKGSLELTFSQMVNHLLPC